MVKTMVPWARSGPQFCGPRARLLSARQLLPPGQQSPSPPTPAHLPVSMTAPATSHEDVADMPAPPLGAQQPWLARPTLSVAPEFLAFLEPGQGLCQGNTNQPSQSTWGQFPPRKIPVSSVPPLAGLVTHKPSPVPRWLLCLPGSSTFCQGNKAVKGTGSKATSCLWDLEHIASPLLCLNFLICKMGVIIAPTFPVAMNNKNRRICEKH